MSRFAVSLISLFLALAAPAMTFAQAGIGSGRATDADVARLASDLNHLGIVENRIRLALQEQLMIQRQRQLLGLEDEEPPSLDRPRRLGEKNTNLSAEQLRQLAEDWWFDNILGPLQDIADNPAASCKLVQTYVVRVIDFQRQRALLGLEEEDYGVMGYIFGDAVSATKRRCLEEAFDECMTTGNGAALADLLVSTGRQAELMGFSDAEFQVRLAYLFRRCTVYKVKFHSESRSQAYYEYKSVVEGSRTLLFQPGPGADVLDQFRNGEWRGPLPAEVDAPDVMLITQSCRSLHPQMRITCGPALRPYPKQAAYQNARAVLTMKRNFSDLEMGSNGSLRIVKKQDGEDTLWLIFLPLGLELELKNVLIPTGRESTLKHFNTLGGFVATFQPGLKIIDFERQGYPVLFQKEVKDSKNFGGAAFFDTTRYEIIHRPDLYPPDQIDPKYELGPEREKSRPPRKPATKPLLRR